MQVDYTYVIGSDETPLVKIGHSEQPEKRLLQIKIGSPWPLRLLWQHGGGQRLERALHQRFAAQRHNGEWFDFGKADPVATVSAATAELIDSGTVTGQRRTPRLPCLVSLNGCLIVYMAPGRWEKDFLGRDELKRPHNPWSAQCTALADTGQRCAKPILDFRAAHRAGLVKYAAVGIEVVGGWVVCERIQLDAREMDRWLRQRCVAHARSFQAWCLPEWEQFDPVRHRELLWGGGGCKPSDSTSYGARELFPLPAQ